MARPSWDDVARVFEEAEALEPGERKVFLAGACGSDSELRREVEALLAAEESADFLETPMDDEPRGQGLIGSTIGGFRVIELLGEGGMGAVYTAEQANPERSVALKVLRSGLASESVRRRFQFESMILGRLQHPNVAQVFEAGVHVFEGGFEVPYFAMERVEGGLHLTQFAEERKLDLLERLELMLDVCDAIDAAHRRGILHRDLKPSNLLVDAQGRVKVIDFGVARAEDDALMTRTGELVGTPSYMSPEQLTGRPEEVDSQSDVWALGVVLFSLITGELPFEVRDLPISQVASVLEVGPKRLTHRAHVVPQDLRHVIEKALEHDRARRYRSVAELADELRRILNHEPVLAVPAGRMYLTAKFVRRNRLLVGAAAAIGLSLIAGTVLATLGLLRARDAEAAARLDAVTAKEEASKFAGMNGVLTSMFTSIDATKIGAEARVVDVLLDRADDLPRELEGQPRVRKVLHVVLAESFQTLGEVAHATEQIEAALEIARSEGAFDEADELHALRVGADIGLAGGMEDQCGERIAEGRRLVERLGLQGCEDDQGLQLIEGKLHRRNRRFDEALAVFRELIVEGEPTTIALEAHYLEAETLRSAERFEESADAYTAYFEALERTQPDEFRKQIAHMGRSEMLMQLERFEEARDTLVNVVPELAQLTGEASGHTRHATNLLSAAQVELGQLEEARALLTTLVEGVAPDESPDVEVLNARQRLAVLSGLLGEGKRSLDELRAALAAARSIYGEEHVRTAKAMSLLGTQLMRLRQLDEAEELLLASLEIRERQNSPSPLERLTVQAVLGEVYFAKGNYGRAVEHFEPAWKGFEEILGPSAQRTSAAGSNAVASLSMMGQYERALPIAERLYERDRQRIEPGHPALMVQAGNLSTMYERVERVPEAEAILIETIASAREAGTDGRPEFADLLFGRSRQLISRGLGEEAQAACTEALEIRGTTRGKNPIAEGMTRIQLAHSHGLLGDDVAALEEFTAAHRILSRSFPPSAPHVTDLIGEIARTLEALDRPREAESWRDRLEGD